jgi:hypothetical protein
VTRHLRGLGSWAVLLGTAGIAGGVVAVTGWERPLPSLAAMIQGGRYLGPGDGVMQQRANDCGPAALADCLRVLGHEVPYPDPASSVRLGPRGCGFGELAAEARRHGRRAAHRRVDPGEIGMIAAPAVLYLRRGHFVAYRGRDAAGQVLLHDPAIGSVGLAPGALARIWTGDVLELGSAEHGSGPHPGGGPEPAPR